jgi:hypothetical protein
VLERRCAVGRETLGHIEVERESGVVLPLALDLGDDVCNHQVH